MQAGATEAVSHSGMLSTLLQVYNSYMRTVIVVYIDIYEALVSLWIENYRQELMHDFVDELRRLEAVQKGTGFEHGFFWKIY